MTVKLREAGPAGVSECRIVVPLVPPSCNHYVKHTRNGRHYVTKEAKKFKEAVAIFCRGRAVAGRSYEIRCAVYLGRNGRGDADNFGKVVLDGLAECGLICSDAKVARLTIEKFRDAANPRTEIVVRAI